MDKSRRKEPFRYVFHTPEPCTFQINRINNQPVDSKRAPAEILNLSRSGCNIATSLKLGAGEHVIGVMLYVQFGEAPWEVQGIIRWHAYEEGLHRYGIQFEASDALRERMSIELRQLAASQRIVAQ
ncbi:PilZ domain-containing protein [Paenibacillus sp. 598K]|uniref:PilZ domain-containing protein n=1 Tax=Paenibacillus sp. 598K TaxID=1117987 RepID=UPI000FFAE403|nr:PilZ domain-containing protein [Paenibacillus sp. 598K]GBF75209.1 PilZ domain-containing protein [Paenibacillus sp. 598K]